MITSNIILRYRKIFLKNLYRWIDGLINGFEESYAKTFNIIKKRMKIIDMEKKGWATGQYQGKLPRRDFWMVSLHDHCLRAESSAPSSQNKRDAIRHSPPMCHDHSQPSCSPGDTTKVK